MSPACGDNTELLPPTETYRYVVSDIHVPERNAAARNDAIDLDGDRSPDNQFGMVLAVLEANALGVADAVHEALLRGGLIMLGELRTTGFDGSSLTTFETSSDAIQTLRRAWAKTWRRVVAISAARQPSGATPSVPSSPRA